MRPWLFLSGELPDQVLLRLAVRRAVAVQNFVKPDLRLLQNVRPLPRIPRQVGLRFARDESPIDGPDLLLLGNRQNRVERAAHGARHILGANYGAIEPPQPLHFAPE